MFKIKITSSYSFARSKDYDDYLERRKEEFKQLRILKSLGFRFKIFITTNYKDERIRRFEPHKAECPERYITDITQFPEEVWDYYKGWNSVQLFTIDRIKPLLFKDQYDYKVDPDSLKDLITLPQVRIDHGLIRFAYVDVLENACTEYLQKKLYDGWRIISCIPQPGQRRPDYIIGKEDV